MLSGLKKYVSCVIISSLALGSFGCSRGEKEYVIREFNPYSKDETDRCLKIIRIDRSCSPTKLEKYIDYFPLGSLDSYSESFLDKKTGKWVHVKWVIPERPEFEEYEKVYRERIFEK